MKAILCSVLFVIASVSMVMAQGTYTQYDVPGEPATYGNGINSAGEIVGAYQDTSSVQHGFLLSGGTFTTIDNPAGGWTYATGINDYGQIVGYGTLAFIYDLQTKVFTDIGIGNLLTNPMAVNNAGTVTGYVLIYDPKLGSVEAGFERFSDGRRQRVGVAGTLYTVPFGISSSGVIVGYGIFPNYSEFDFAFSGRKYKMLTFGGTVLGINPQATALVGYYSASGVLSGFLYQNGTLTTLQFPGATSTVAIGINRSGEVVGYFQDSIGYHGFLWTPPSDLASE